MENQLTREEKIARMLHGVNKLWCELNGDYSQLSWEGSPAWKHKATQESIKNYHPNMTPGFAHRDWMRAKIADGWVYGPTKNGQLKTHPALVPFEDLSEFERTKDHLVLAVLGVFDTLSVIAGDSES